MFLLLILFNLFIVSATIMSLLWPLAELVSVTQRMLLEAPEMWLNFNYRADAQCLMNTHSSYM